MKMIKQQLFVLFLLTISVNSLNLCSDWTQFKDTKCFKVLEKVETEEEALHQCSQLDSTSILPTIHSKDEQHFLETLLKKYSKLSSYAWIGMKIKNQTSVEWMDGSDANYSNWGTDVVRDGSLACVEMSLSSGKWTDTSCKKKALTVCQKKQELTLSALKNVIESQQDQINSIIPLGFIYTQLPNQSSPHQLWPHMKWTEVTNQYSGLFFRAEGGNSAPFGENQQANQTWISDVKMIGWHTSGEKSEYAGNPVSVSMKESSWTELYADGVHDHIKMYTTGGENRPENTAVRMWRRTE